jgi:hypothetical protein
MDVGKVFAVAALALLLTVCGTPSPALGPGSASPASIATPRVALPTPIPQPITRTSAAAQVAWLDNGPSTGPATMLVGVDPAGKVVGRLPRDLGRFYRSADGAQLFVFSDRITAYSAADGSVTRSYGALPGGMTLDAAFSPDGHWLAYLTSQAVLGLVDLRSSAVRTTKVAHDLNATHVGMTCATCDPAALLWSTLLFSPDSQRLYTIVDWGGPLRLTAFDVTVTAPPDRIAEIATSPSPAGGKPLPSCGGPGIAPRAVNGGKTIAIYCHVDAQVMFFDAVSLASTGVVQAEMRNPFWIAPIFTPDGQMLYLRQYPAFGDQVQVVDLRSQKLIGPVPTPQKLTDPAPFSWSALVAYAGGTPSTVPVSPDGTKLYAAGPDGIAVLRIPDLKPLAKLAPGLSVNEVWVSGDGRTVYATTADRALIVIGSDGSAKRADLRDVGSFIASEHG